MTANKEGSMMCLKAKEKNSETRLGVSCGIGQLALRASNKGGCG
jgi:ubiquinone/menaquinone biosynthesis C-methylase UbiE